MAFLYQASYIVRTWAFIFFIAFAYIAFIHYPNQMSFKIISPILFTIFLVCFVFFYGGRKRLASNIMSGIGFYRVSCDTKKVVIGGGVSSVLRKQALPSGKPTYMQSGRISSKLWHAGTPIWRVQAELATEGKAILSHPSYASATLGGWIFTNSHGSGGTLWKSCFGTLKIDEQDTDGKIIKTFITKNKAKYFGDSISEEDARKYIIKEVEIFSVPDVIVQRDAYNIFTLNDFTKFFICSSYLRLIMINRKVMTAFVWKPAAESALQKNFWIETFFPPWLATICPAWVFASISRDRWTRIMRLGKSSEFGPQEPNPVPLLSTAFLAFSFLYDNFELFIKCHVTPTLLYSLCHAIKKEFESGLLRGRCEVRCGSRKLFLDFALISARCHLPRMFMRIKNILGPDAKVTLHRGKLDVDIYPLLDQANHSNV